MSQRRAAAPQVCEGYTDPVRETSTGTYILQPGVDAAVYRPSWKQTNTIFRPYPSRSYTDPDGLEPYLPQPMDPTRRGNWIRRYDCAWSVGEKRGVTFVTRRPDKNTFTSLDALPLSILNMTIRKAIKDPATLRHHPEFLALTQGSAGKAAPLSAIRSVNMMQGLLLVHNNQLTYNDGNPPGIDRACILMISGPPSFVSRGNPDMLSTAEKLLLQLDQEKENYNGDPNDFESRFVHGDPVAPEHGRFFHFREAGTMRFGAQISTGPATRAGYRQAAQRPVGSPIGGGKGYEVEISDQPLPDGSSPRMDDEESIERIKDRWLFWEDTIRVMTPLEQAHLLNEVFSPDPIIFAFKDRHPEWITDETWKIARGSVSVRAETPPLTGWEAQQAAHQGGYASQANPYTAMGQQPHPMQHPYASPSPYTRNQPHPMVPMPQPTHPPMSAGNEQTEEYTDWQDTDATTEEVVETQIAPTSSDRQIWRGGVTVDPVLQPPAPQVQQPAPAPQATPQRQPAPRAVPPAQVNSRVNFTRQVANNEPTVNIPDDPVARNIQSQIQDLHRRSPGQNK